MADVHDKLTRSFNMSQIRSKDTKPELVIRKFLHSSGLRYRLHDNKLPGKPDLVFPKFKTVLFVHGCFWHGHDNCKYFVIPKTRTDWCLKKINKNKANDLKNFAKLKKLGWKAFTIFECELKKLKQKSTLNKILTRFNKLSLDI
ncbi:MAG: DNA mismatch endonuclease Vsr [Bacteroidetes bacterium]|nr:DNA mismatch endonuclease Vsr [Bacteroidota bacterium]